MAELTRLPDSTLDAYDWQFEGACREADPKLFLPPREPFGVWGGLTEEDREQMHRLEHHQLAAATV